MTSRAFRETAKIGIIGGSGLYELLEDKKHVVLETPFGKTPRIEVGYVDGVKTAFLPRHAKPGSLKVSHAVPPSEINYRANVYGLRMLGIERIYSTNAVGSINTEISPGQFVIVDQLIDATKRRVGTFYDGKTRIRVNRDKVVSGVVHVDFTSPYCPELRGVLINCCKELGFGHRESGTYVCTEGPRFETPAEIIAYRTLGADVVGMTNYPECILARELSMCYASVAMSTNYAAGTGPKKITHEEVKEIFESNIDKVRTLLKRAIKFTPMERECDCVRALVGATA
jgi:5'-methylthioadenosine phosphorylase